MKQNHFFYSFYFLVVGFFILGLSSLARLCDQAQRDSTFRENRIKEFPFGFPPQHPEDSIKTTSEATNEIALELSTRVEDDKDTRFLFWSVLLSFVGVSAVTLIQEKYSKQPSENRSQ